ncbi:hypothetical protein ACHWQZ_G004717 [Mnemiopsis leidyi]
MSIQWLLVSGFLYSEIALALLLSIPWISCKRWHRIFNSSIMGLITSYVNWIFICFLSCLVVLFADSLREMYVYTGQDKKVDMTSTASPSAQEHILMKLFRAQRNFYITGISLFLLIVLRTMLMRVSKVARLEANYEAMQKQAASAGSMNKTLLDENSALKKMTEGKEDLLEEVKKMEELKDQVKAAEKKASQSKADADAMRKQSENLTMEYDRLLTEHQKLQDLITPGDKKDD